MRLPDGSPAAGVPLKVDVKESTEKSWQGLTDQDGTAVPVFNIQSVSQITVKVSISKLTVLHFVLFCLLLTVFLLASIGDCRWRATE